MLKMYVDVKEEEELRFRTQRWLRQIRSYLVLVDSDALMRMRLPVQSHIEGVKIDRKTMQAMAHKSQKILIVVGLGIA